MTAGGGTLVLVGTPLGNRGDLSPRARAAVAMPRRAAVMLG